MELYAAIDLHPITALCLPTGQPWQMDAPMPFKFLQTADRLVFLFEEYHGLAQIVFDPAKALPPGFRSAFAR